MGKITPMKRFAKIVALFLALSVLQPYLHHHKNIDDALKCKVCVLTKNKLIKTKFQYSQKSSPTIYKAQKAPLPPFYKTVIKEKKRDPPL